METIREIIQEHIQVRKQLVSLAVVDLKRNFSGSQLGWIWAFIRPAILIFVFWFAFAMGLRSGADKDGHPFFLWLIAGMIPWFYMREEISGGSNCMRKYRSMVTRIKYPVSTIPTFISMSNFTVHLGLLVIMIIIYALFGYFPTIYFLELPIYMLMMFLFFTAWSLFASLISCISKDFLNLIRALTQAMFWMSGILYDAASIDIPWIRAILLFNPVTIVVTGYRNVFTKHMWFWEDWQHMINFLIVYAVMLLLVAWAYRKLRKVIPDVI